MVTMLQKNKPAVFSIIISLLVLAAAGTTAARNEDLEFKDLKYEVTGQDTGSVSLALIIIVCNNSETDYKCDILIDMVNSKGEKIGSSGLDGVISEANKDKKLTLKVRVPKKDFSPPLKLTGRFKNVEPKS